jgi:hypothetical protein
MVYIKRFILILFHSGQICTWRSSVHVRTLILSHLNKVEFDSVCRKDATKQNFVIKISLVSVNHGINTNRTTRQRSISNVQICILSMVYIKRFILILFHSGQICTWRSSVHVVSNLFWQTLYHINKMKKIPRCWLYVFRKLCQLYK